MKQIPTYKERGVAGDMNGYSETYSGSETNTDYLNKHAGKWEPPFGGNLHLHLIYARSVHWRVVDRASSVCKVPGRCHRVNIIPDAVTDGINAVFKKAFSGGHAESCASKVRAPGW